MGVVTGTRGLKGDLRIKSFTDDPADVAAYGPLTDATGSRTLRLRVTGIVKGQVIARADGVADRDAAEALKGTELYVPREALPAAGEDEYYHADLIGLRVMRSDAAPETAEVGRVKAIFDFGAGDVLEVEESDGRTVFLPFNRQVVPEIDLAGGWLRIDPPDGLLDNAADGTKEDDGTTG